MMKATADRLISGERSARPRRRLWRTRAFWGAAALSLAMVGAPTRIEARTARQTTVVDQVAATVNGEVITLSDVKWLIRYRRIQPPEDPQARRELYRSTLQQVIEQQLIAAESSQTPGIQVTPEEVSRRVEAYRSQFPSQTAFEENLVSMEMTLDDLRELVRRQLAVLKFVKLRFEPFIIPLPDEIRGYYERELLPEFETGGLPPPPLSAVEEQIRQILTLQKTNQEVDRWVSGAIAKARVEILLDREPAASPNLPPGLADQSDIQPLKPPL